MTVKNESRQTEAARKKEIKQLKSDLKLYKVALDNTNHSKRRHELEQKISAAREQLTELGVDPDSKEVVVATEEQNEDSKDKTVTDKISAVPDKMGQVAMPQESSRAGWLFALLLIGAGAGYLLFKNLQPKEEEE